jgi:hypothetical protein
MIDDHGIAEMKAVGTYGRLELLYAEPFAKALVDDPAIPSRARQVYPRKLTRWRTDGGQVGASVGRTHCQQTALLFDDLRVAVIRNPGVAIVR